MMAAGGAQENATSFAAESSKLTAAMMKQMWNGSAFCDGVCTAVGGHSLVMSNMFTLAFGMVPDAHVASVWRTVADWGLEQMGDYGAFWYQVALSGSYYGAQYDPPSDGSELYKALTKCDLDSWCSGLRDDNLTMTRESWHDGTYSHEWGASPLVGITWGLMGVQQTAPGFQQFIVKPKLGGLTRANITVPTIRGHIHVSASPGLVEVAVPCNTAATLCIPRAASDKLRYTPETHRLLLDGNEVAASPTAGGHLCTAGPVGCGANGAARALTAVARW